MDYSGFAHDVHILASFIYIYTENDTVTYVAPLAVEVILFNMLNTLPKVIVNFEVFPILVYLFTCYKPVLFICLVCKIALWQLKICCTCEKRP